MFCTGPLAYYVRWREAPTPRGSYPFADGHSWAEPDMDHASELCQQVAKRRLVIATNPDAADPCRDALVLADYRNQFSFATAVAR